MPRTKDAARKSGSKFYYTAVACVNGHVSERRTTSGGCVQCVRDKSNEWHAKKRAEGGEWLDDRKKKKVEAQSRRWHEDAAWRVEITAVRQGWHKDKLDGDVEYKERFLKKQRDRYQNEPEYRAKIIERVKAYQSRRRENEELDAFMERMEREAEERERENAA